MKTSLIQLTSATDWRAAVARIRGGAQGRVILVWPDKGAPSSPRLVLRLMQRRSLAKRVPLAVVSTDPYIRAESEKLGLPLFHNARQARRENWALSQPLAAPQKPVNRSALATLRAHATTRRAAFIAKPTLFLT